jgi:hypothetical protein
LNIALHSSITIHLLFLEAMNSGGNVKVNVLALLFPDIYSREHSLLTQKYVLVAAQARKLRFAKSAKLRFAVEQSSSPVLIY